MRLIFFVLLSVVFATGAFSQGRFDPVIEVGDEVVTRYQLDQRTLFLTLLRAPGDARELAREQLINETLQLQAARGAGITPTAEEIASGINEFAARANLSGDEFLRALAANGVEAQTFRDFITAGVAWRSFVRAELGEDARDISPYSLRLAYGRDGTEGGVRVKLWEIILPAGDEATAAASSVRATELAAISDLDEFREAARVFSIAGSTASGGDVGWRALEALPEPLRPVLASLAPGQTSRPIRQENAIAIYHLEDRENVPAGAPSDPSVDYALLIADDAAEAARAAERADTCDDLYGVLGTLPPERLIRETVRTSALPADLRAIVGGLDENEKSLAVTRGGRPALFMLCERGSGAKSAVDYEITGNRILNTRLAGMASAYLADLRARTYIRILP